MISELIVYELSTDDPYIDPREFVDYHSAKEEFNRLCEFSSGSVNLIARHYMVNILKNRYEFFRAEELASKPKDENPE